MIGLYDTTLWNIITGIKADDNVNVRNLFTVGMDTVAKTESQLVCSYSHKRNTKVKILASAKTVKVTEDRTIDLALLFQRFMVVSQSGELTLDEMMKYELSSYTPSLFETKQRLRIPDKPAFLEDNDVLE